VSARHPLRPDGRARPLLPPWPLPPTVAWLPRCALNVGRGVPALQVVHPLGGCLRPPPLPRPAGRPASPTPQSPRAGARLPASYSRNSSLCAATHCPGFSCHRSTRCPASPILLLPPAAPRVQRRP